MRMMEKNNRNTRGMLTECKLFFIYGLVFLFFIFKMFYYLEEVWYVPDEEAHVSYIAYLEENPGKIIPRFEDMKLYGGGFGMDGLYWYYDEGKICYLGHPPLYYKMMQMVGTTVRGETPDGQERIFVDLYRFKLANILLTGISMLLILYVGYTRIGSWTKSGFYHGLYAVAASSVPMLALCGSGITNDNLANLGVVLFLLGVLRYYEEKIGYVTYLLAAAGFFLSIMSKLTIGELLVVMLAVILAADWMRHKSPRLILNRYFLASLPVYILAAVYFLIIYTRYGNIQPGLDIIAPEQMTIVDEAERLSMSFGQYLRYFITQFGYTWSGIYNGRFYEFKILHPGAAKPFFYLIYGLFVMAAVSLVKLFQKKKNTYGMVYISAAAAFSITLITQFFNAYNSYLTRGYEGGYQARYYLCIIPFFALAAGELFCLLDKLPLSCLAAKLAKKEVFSDATGRIVMGSLSRILALAGILWLLYGDFLYFLAMHNQYMW